MKNISQKDLRSARRITLREVAELLGSTVRKQEEQEEESFALKSLVQLCLRGQNFRRMGCLPKSLNSDLLLAAVLEVRSLF